MTEYIEMLWRCRHCNNENPGLSGEDEGLRCENCGSQKADEPFYMPGNYQTVAAVTDPELLRRAKAGPNWTCTHCRHQERKLHSECSVCGAARYDVEAPPSLRDPEADTDAIRSKGIDDFQDLASSLRTSEGRRKVSRAMLKPTRDLSGTSELDWPDDERPSRPVYPSFLAETVDTIARKPEGRAVRRKLLIGLLVLVLGFLIAWLFWWLFATHTTTVKVTELKWQRTTRLEERHIKDGEGWKSSMPSDAFDRSCENRFKEHEDCNPHDCNPHSVSYECNCTGGDSYSCNCQRVCVPQGNGSAACNQVCDTCTNPRVCQTCTRTEYDTCYDRCPVYEDWCTYRYPKWEVMKTDVNTGIDNNPIWPELEAQGEDQRIRRNGHQTASFADTSSERTWPDEDVAEDTFRTLRVGLEQTAKWKRSGAFELVP